MSHETQTYTAEQARIVKEYSDLYGIESSQISFDGTDLRPVFDHNAVSVLSLRLTDIQDISPIEILDDGNTVTIFGRTLLKDGRSRGWIGSSSVGEILGNGVKVDNVQVAKGVAISRGFRQGIRNVGVDLHAAHRKFADTGEIAETHTNRDPRASAYAELHVLATELDLIVDGNKAGYREYIAENYDGRSSAKDLNDVELQKLIIQFRSLARLRRASHAQTAAA